MKKLVNQLGILQRIHNNQCGWWSYDDILVQGGSAPLTKESIIGYVATLVYSSTDSNVLIKDNLDL